MGELKKTSNDYIFGRPIGEGSFSTVYLAKEVNTRMKCAIKVCEKRLIRREKKQLAIMRERQIMKILTDNPSPFFIKLICTFQDDDRLFFVMNYAKNGELLPFINKIESFDEKCSRFYSGEILLALEHLHKLGIVHRDLKPENILLNEEMHIQVTDFGSALILNNDNCDTTNSPNDDLNNSETQIKRKNSFVGTAHYVSPEMLTDKSATTSSDLWAFGCILYQMISGVPPFRAPNEYLIFQKIMSLDYEFSNSFSDSAMSLIEKILQKSPSDRLGANDNFRYEGYVSIKKHEFFSPLAKNWSLINETPPKITSNISADSVKKEDLNETKSDLEIPENLEPGLTDNQITRLLGLELHEDFNIIAKKGILDLSQKERNDRLKIQRQQNIYHRFVEENLIIKQGLIDKKKGLFARRRMFLLTTGPHLYYVDPTNMVLKGQIPWSKDMKTEAKNFRIFYVHTPNRTYYLEDILGEAPEWRRVIEEVRKTTFDNSSEVNVSNTSTLYNTNVPLRKISINDKILR